MKLPVEVAIIRSCHVATNRGQWGDLQGDINVMRNAALICIVTLSLVIGARSQTTEFTYQGRLTVSGVAATTPHDFEFRLFTAPTGGIQIGTTLSRPNVSLSSGVFTVPLDFGEQFDGTDRWLRIDVRPAGGTTFEALTPRQRITSAPYNIKSLSATSAEVAANALQLGGVAANQYVITTDPRMSDSRTPLAGSADYIQNNPPSPQSANFSISGSGSVGGNLGVGTTTPNDRLEVSGSGIVRARVNSNSNAGLSLTLNGQPGWSVASVSGGQFQIYNDAIAQNALWINSASNNVGIGTIAPAAKLDVAGNINTSTQYNIGGTRILSNAGAQNLFAGQNAGLVNTGGSNSFFGRDAGASNTDGYSNSFFGQAAGTFNVSGFENAFFGTGAGRNSRTSFNSFFGWAAGVSKYDSAPEMLFLAEALASLTPTALPTLSLGRPQVRRIPLEISMSSSAAMPANRIQPAILTLSGRERCGCPCQRSQSSNGDRGVRGWQRAIRSY